MLIWVGFDDRIAFEPLQSDLFYSCLQHVFQQRFQFTGCHRAGGIRRPVINMQYSILTNAPVGKQYSVLCRISRILLRHE